MGESLATGRPCWVIMTSPPLVTWPSNQVNFALALRVPTVMVVGIMTLRLF